MRLSTTTVTAAISAVTRMVFGFMCDTSWVGALRRGRDSGCLSREHPEPPVRETVTGHKFVT